MIADYVFTNKPTLTVLIRALYLEIIVERVTIKVWEYLQQSCYAHRVIASYSVSRAASFTNGVADDVHIHARLRHRERVSLLREMPKKVPTGAARRSLPRGEGGLGEYRHGEKQREGEASQVQQSPSEAAIPQREIVVHLDDLSMRVLGHVGSGDAVTIRQPGT